MFWCTYILKDTYTAWNFYFADNYVIGMKMKQHDLKLGLDLRSRKGAHQEVCDVWIFHMWCVDLIWFKILVRFYITRHVFLLCTHVFRFSKITINTHIPFDLVIINTIYIITWSTRNLRSTILRVSNVADGPYGWCGVGIWRINSIIIKKWFGFFTVYL